jgi:hypothetical protein
VNEGLQLDEEAMRALRERREAVRVVAVPLWLIAVALLAIVVALW